MSKNDKDDDYEVGFGKPPRKNQFKQGQSGNPNGRPKKSEKASSFAQMFAEYMSGKIQIAINGSSKKVPRKKAFLMAVFRDAMNGDPRARRQLMDLIKLAGLLDSNTAGDPSAFLVMRAAFPAEVEEALVAMQQAPFRDGHKPPLSAEVLEEYRQRMLANCIDR